MGRPKKIKAIVSAEEYNKMQDAKEATTVPTQDQECVNVPVAPIVEQRKRGRPRKVDGQCCGEKVIAKQDLHSIIAEFKLAKQALTDKYMSKIQKLMNG